MRRSRQALVASLAATLVTGLLGAGSAAGGVALRPADGRHAEKPTRVLIVLFDQMRPEYADRFHMKNFKRLRAHGTNFAKAYLGYMGSETVISHNVITSGLEPRHMGWVDEAYRDTENLLGGGAGAMWITGNFGLTEFGTLIQNEGYPKLADYLHEAFPGTKFIAVGQKSYAIESTAAPTGDIAVRMSSRGAAALCPLLGGAWRSPSGLNVPTYLTEPMCGRFYVNSDSANDYGPLGK